MNDNDSRSDKGNEVHVDIGNLSSAGHVVISGGDAHVTGSTHGDGQDNQARVVGGVDTTEDEFVQLQQALSQLESSIDEANLEDDILIAAKHNAKSIKEQLTTTKKPNEHILKQASEALLKYGPRISGALVATFTTPLVGKIVSSMGERALEFYSGLHNGDSESDDE